MIFKDAMLWRMIWKEYRAQRGFWLVIAGFAVVLILLFLWLLDATDHERTAAPWIIAISLPAVYALGCTLVMFATEREDGTTGYCKKSWQPARVACFWAKWVSVSPARRPCGAFCWQRRCS